MLSCSQRQVYRETKLRKKEGVRQRTDSSTESMGSLVGTVETAEADSSVSVVSLNN